MWVMIRFVTKPRDCASPVDTQKRREIKNERIPSEGGQLNQVGIREKRGYVITGSVNLSRVSGMPKSLVNHAGG